jgi:hypothetical protein
MKIVLEKIESENPRLTSELSRGEVVEHSVEILIGHQRRRLKVFIRVNALPSMDASFVYGDALVEELLRFDPEALSRLYSAVGKFRRGIEVSLPLVLAETTQMNGGDRVNTASY